MSNLSRPSRSGTRLSAVAAGAAIAISPLVVRESNASARDDCNHGRFDGTPSFVAPQGPQVNQPDPQPLPPDKADVRSQIADRVSTGMVNKGAGLSTSATTGYGNHPPHAGKILGASSRYRFSVEGDRSLHPAVSGLSGAPGAKKVGVEDVMLEVLDRIGHLAMYIKSPEDNRVKTAIRDALQRNLHRGDGANLTEANREIEVRDIFSDILDCLERGKHYSYNSRTQRATLKSAGEDRVQGLFSVFASYDPGKMPKVEKIERGLSARHICEYLLSRLERGQHYEIVKNEKTKGTKVVLTEEGKSEVRALIGLDVNNIEQSLYHYEVFRVQGLSREQAAAKVSKEFAVNAALADPFEEIKELPRDWMATIVALYKERGIDHLNNYDTETVQLTERGIGQVCHHLRIGNLDELAKDAQAQIEKAIAEIAFKKDGEADAQQQAMEMDAETLEVLKAKEEAAERLARLVRRAVKETLRSDHVSKKAARRTGSKVIFPVDYYDHAAEVQEEQQAVDLQEDQADAEEDQDFYELEGHERESELEARYAEEIAAKGDGKEDGIEEARLAALQTTYPEAFNPMHPKNGARKGNGVDYEDLDIHPAASRQAVREALKIRS